MKISQPTPELQVPDVRQAQEYYRDRLGFEISWQNVSGRIGAVSRGECAIFFRETDEAPAPSVFWVFCEEIDAAHADCVQRGAEIVEAPSNKPGGLRQFTLRDAFGNLYHFHCDI